MQCSRNEAWDPHTDAGMNEVEEANEKSSIWAEAYSDWTLKHGRGVQSGGKDEVEEAAEAIERQRLKVFLFLSLSLSSPFFLVLSLSLSHSPLSLSPSRFLFLFFFPRECCANKKRSHPQISLRPTVTDRLNAVASTVIRS